MVVSAVTMVMASSIRCYSTVGLSNGIRYTAGVCWQSRYVWHKGMYTIIGGKLVLDFHRNLCIFEFLKIILQPNCTTIDHNSLR